MLILVSVTNKFQCDQLGPNLDTKIALQKKSKHSKENSLPQGKKFVGFVKCFSEFNLALTIVIVLFSIVQFILFLHLASNN